MVTVGLSPSFAGLFRNSSSSDRPRLPAMAIGLGLLRRYASAGHGYLAACTMTHCEQPTKAIYRKQRCRSTEGIVSASKRANAGQPDRDLSASTHGRAGRFRGVELEATWAADVRPAHTPMAVL